VVLPSQGPEAYSNVRWWVDCKVGYPTMCITPKILALGARDDYNVLANLR
jgi:hypothetical protein